MPIGKNAIKRVENNGYSKVESTAPDMENSSVIANIDEQVLEKIVAPVEKKAAAPKRKYTKKAKPAPVVEAPVVEAPVAEAPKPKRKYTKKAKPVAKEGFARVEVGNDMPYYLL